MSSYIQGRIIGTLVRSLLAADFAIDVNDNDGDFETHLTKSSDYAAIMAAIFNPDLDSADYCLDCWKGGKPDAEGHSFGMVRLIDGNGVSVISDYSVSLEDAVAPASALANEIDRDEDGWLASELMARDGMLAALGFAVKWIDMRRSKGATEPVPGQLEGSLRASIAKATGVA